MSSFLSAASALVAIGLCAWPQSALAGRFKLHKIVDSTDEVPGGTGKFSDFGYPQVSDGNVAFLTGDGIPLANGVFLWTETAGLVPIAGKADESTGGAPIFFPPGISGEDVAFCGFRTGTQGVFFKPAQGAMKTLAVSLPGQPGFSYFQSSCSVSGANVAFTTYFQGATGTATKGVYVSANGGTPGLVANDIGGYEYEVALSGNAVAYVSGYSGAQTVNVSGRGRIAGPVVLGKTYTDFSDVTISGDNVAFVARNPAGESAIFFHDGTTIREIAHRGQKMPGATASGHATGKFQYFARPCVSGNRVVFYAEDGLTSYNNGIFLYENGHIIPVVDGHTTFGGRTADRFQGFVADFSLSGGGQCYDGKNIGVYVRYRTGVKALWLIEDTHRPSGGGNQPNLPPGVSGQILFEKIMPGPHGLDPHKTRWIPAAGIPVLAVTDSDILDGTTTDSSGKYYIQINTPNTFAIAALAQNSVALVTPFVSPPSAYKAISDTLEIPTAGQGVECNLRIADRQQASAPFNIVSALQKGADLVHAGDPTAVLPRVNVYWAPDYRGGTAYYPEEDLIKINGDRKAAGSGHADEFNDMAVLHEYGHFLQTHFSHPNDVGGTHRRGDKLDPRLAWNEGWADFFAAASLDSRVFFLLGKNTTQVFPLEPKSLGFDKPPGYWSEFSVASALWHIFAPDSRHAEGKHLGLGFAPVWQAFTELKGRPFVFAGDFLDRLVAADFSLGAGIDAITRPRGFPYVAGGDPSVSPVWRQRIAFGQSLGGSANSFTKSRNNLLNASAFYFFDKASDGNAIVQLEAADRAAPHSNLDLYLWDTSQKLVAAATAYDTGVAATKTIVANLSAGRYFIEVRSWSKEEFEAPVLNAGAFTLRLTAAP